MRIRLLGVLTVANVAALLLIYAGAAAPQPKADAVEAKQFILRDEKGRMRADLAMGADGNPRLTLYDESAKPVAGLLGPIDGGIFFLRSGAEPQREIQLSVSKKGTLISLSDAPGVPRILLSSGYSSPQLYILDEKKNYQIGIGLKDGEPLLHMKNSKGEEVHSKP